MAADQYLWVLVLASTPGGRVPDWQPFAKSDGIGKIVDGVNSKCRERYRDRPKEDLQKCLWLLNVLLSDLTTLGTLGKDTLNKVQILLASVGDLRDAVDNKPDLSRLIFARLSGRPHIFVQTSVNANDQSIFDRFAALSLAPTDPPVFYSQDRLEAWLVNTVTLQMGLCQGFDAIDPKSGQNASAPASSRVEANYQRSKSDLVARVRNVAVGRNWSAEDASNLLRATAVQEYAILSAADAAKRSISGSEKLRTSVEALRPDVNMLVDRVPEADEQVKYQPVPLLEIRLKQPFETLMPDQRVAAEEFGLRAGNSSTLHYDAPTLGDKLDQLGKAVKVTQFSAALPTFTVDASLGRFKPK